MGRRICGRRKGMVIQAAIGMLVVICSPQVGLAFPLPEFSVGFVHPEDGASAVPTNTLLVASGHGATPSFELYAIVASGDGGTSSDAGTSTFDLDGDSSGMALRGRRVFIGGRCRDVEPNFICFIDPELEPNTQYAWDARVGTERAVLRFTTGPGSAVPLPLPAVDISEVPLPDSGAGSCIGARDLVTFEARFAESAEPWTLVYQDGARWIRPGLTAVQWQGFANSAGDYDYEQMDWSGQSFKHRARVCQPFPEDPQGVLIDGSETSSSPMADALDASAAMGAPRESAATVERPEASDSCGIAYHSTLRDWWWGAMGIVVLALRRRR